MDGGGTPVRRAADRAERLFCRIFAALNGAVRELTGVHMALYTVTDWLSLIPIFVAIGFAALGLWQLIRRKSVFKVDYNIIVLGGFYVLVMAVYLFFEAVVVNYRPVLIDGFLEASYSSSTTVLVMCVIPDGHDATASADRQ